jgi:hypothetical protein
MSSFFNGNFHVWSKRQEILSIPREVIDMAALITPQNAGYLFWAAKQPGTDKFEIGLALQPQVFDFTSAWQLEPNPALKIEGPWKGLGALYSEGILSLLIDADQARLLQLNNRNWNFTSSLSSLHSPLQIVQKTESVINYTTWLNTGSNTSTPLFAREIGLAFISTAPNSVETLESPPSPSVSSDINTPGTSEEASPENETLTESYPTVESPADRSESVETKEALVSIINGIQETTSSLTIELQALGEKVNPISEVLEALVKKNEETLEALRMLEEKVSLKIEREIATKKGFWARWFT